MITFKANTRSNFVGTDGKWVKLGSWRPTYFCYWLNEETGKQWLIVGPTRVVEINGKTFSLEEVPECGVNSLEDLEGPCVAKRWHKSFFVPKVKEPKIENELTEWVDAQLY